MEIRRALPHDAAAVAQQMKTVADEGRWLATQSDRGVEELADMFREGLAAGNILFVLEHEQRVVGMAGLNPTGIDGVHNLGMSILPEFRGQGWGRRLLNRLLDAARAAGIRKIVLEVFPENGRAIALYASSGFEVEGFKRDHYPRLDGSKRSAILMAHFPAKGAP
jgi:ribosomal protein S18 acetylase RimI-like enzyme